MEGIERFYDTFDSQEFGRMESIEEIYERVFTPLQKCVGIVVSGTNTLSSPSDQYWGRAITLHTGEHLQMRFMPSGSIGTEVGANETRMIASRRTGHGILPQVSTLICFLPRDSFALDGKMPLANGHSIGCRGLHILLPSLFSKHDPHRERNVGHAQLDRRGFHSVRPTSICLQASLGPTRQPNGDFLFTSGDAYLVFAGQMAGVDIADPLHRASDNMSESEHTKYIIARQRRLVQALGETKATRFISSALTVCELLSVEGVLGMVSNRFFSGAMSDTSVSPVGLPLCIVVAINVALHPTRYKLPNCTKQDAFCNQELIRSFRSRWDKVMPDGFRAIDCAMKWGFDNAKQQCVKSGMDVQLFDNLQLWQRIGQRAISKLMSDPREDQEFERVEYTSRAFGLADLIFDRVSDRKYAEFGKKGFLQRIGELPIDRVFLAQRSDLVTVLFKMMDASEDWLRTGMFGEHRLSKANLSILPESKSAQRFANFEKSRSNSDSDSTSSSSIGDGDEESVAGDAVLEKKFTLDAMESAAAAISVAILHGPFVVQEFDIQCFLVGEGCVNVCADCDSSVHVIQATMFASKASSCSLCNRPRCFSCTKSSMKSGVTDHCLRCHPDAPRARESVSPKHKKKGKNKRGALPLDH